MVQRFGKDHPEKTDITQEINSHSMSTYTVETGVVEFLLVRHNVRLRVLETQVMSGEQSSKVMLRSKVIISTTVNSIFGE